MCISGGKFENKNILAKMAKIDINRHFGQNQTILSGFCAFSQIINFGPLILGALFYDFKNPTL